MRNKIIRQFTRVWQVLRLILLVLLTVVLVGSLSVLSDKYIHKSLWEWLQLLLAVAVTSMIAFYTEASRRREKERERDQDIREREIASDRNQEATLRNYLGIMTELLLENDLRTSKPETEVRTAARTRTLIVLEELEPKRKRTVIQFLIEAGLISGKPAQEHEQEQKPVISLNRANLRGVSLAESPALAAIIPGRTNLSWADLRGATLLSVNLSRVDLEGANLSGAFLMGAVLYGASLQGAILIGTWLGALIPFWSGANLHEADLSKADLSGASLEGANLDGADLRGAILSGVGFDEHTTLPDDTNWTPDADMERFTDPDHPDFWRSDNPESPAYRADDE